MKFIALYLAPAAGLEEWMKLPEEARKADEEKMKEDWDVWMTSHKEIFIETNATGATKKVTEEGVSDVKNDVMLYSIVEGESAEVIAERFKNHPHFGIPGGSIEIMPIRPI